ncbi:T9SS type A sorting domain-containing protein [Dokdonia sp. Hel_I_53]|uniref:T9SS type A sorting domain-containing protein n=1 Tax=Dokdonia sp. Hel_I_53 TaxID=1566287 RepID=UPI00119B463C|nr:T9SS type A sorting domain-containing protein [Dokdonia sp. Hel_I_53]TVZ52724.1 putative secreted protein (Por secretion system target) [Dokdonia sp. Hel_I_53]
MMRLFYFLLILFVSGVCNAQLGSKAPWMNKLDSQTRSLDQPTFKEIVNSFEAYWSDKDETTKGSGYKPFKRWESLYQYYLNTDGAVMKPTQLWDAWKSINETRSIQLDNSDWKNIGPLTHTNTGSWSAGQGRVNAMAVDPNNPATIYVGAPAGGLWKSNDTGNSWVPLTDNLPQIGVSGIAIDQTNSDIIYIATGDDDAGDSYSVGVLKSINGGITWEFTDLNVDNSPSSMNDIIIDPSNNEVLWVSTNQGIFKTENGGDVWVNVVSGNFQDLKIKPGSSNVLYAATSSRIFKSSDAGDSWEPVSTGFITGASRIVLDVTPANPDVLYAFKSDNSYGAGEIYKSDDSGNTFTKTYNGSPNVFESTQAWYDMAFAVSDTDENEIYTGVLNIWKSTDGGTNFTKLNNWNSPNDASYTHADIHNLNFIDGILYCGSDGGFYASTDQGTTFTSYTDGLAIGQFYKIDVATSDASLIAGGLQDNGGYARANDIWQNYYGADGMENVFDPQDPSKVYGFTQNGGGLYTSITGGASNDGSFGGPEEGNWITPLAFSKDKKLYAAYRAIYELNLCSNSWTAISSRFSEAIDKLETDPNDQNTMFIATGSTLRMSTNGGAEFSIVESFNRNISSIEVNNNNSSILYIVTGGSNGRIYKGNITNDSIDFVDITGSLPSIPKLVIKHQNYEGNNPLYLGTALGVWKYNDTTADWEPFQNNLPHTAVRDLDINEKNGILTAGTYGRGIWQSAIEITPVTNDLSSTSLVIKNNQSLSCSETATILTFENNGTSVVTAANILYNAAGITNNVQWSGSLQPEETTAVELPPLGLSAGSYILSASITVDGDQRIDNNDASVSIYVNEESAGNIINEFESQEDELLIISSSDNINCAASESVWQRGIPSGTSLNTTISGENVYGTTLSGDHPNNVKEYLTTKCYDISSLEIPVLTFYMAFELENNFDVLYVEYTTDDANTWSVLGSANDPNWYNSNYTNCVNCKGAQWTGKDDTSWKQYSYDLSDFASQTNMMFRFVFHSDQGVAEEGVIIDNLKIGQAPLSTDDIVINGLAIYPNPSNGVFTVNWAENTPVTLEVFDVLGKSITKEININEGEKMYMLDLNKFASGLYLLKIHTANKQLTKKLILN